MQQQQSQQARSAVSSLPNTSSPRPASSPCSVQSAHPELSTSQAQSFNSGSNNIHATQNQDSMDRSTPKSGEGVSSSSPFSDPDLPPWSGLGGLGGLGDDLFKNVDLDMDFDLDDELSGANNNSLHSINNNNLVDEKSGGSGRILRSSSENEQKISIPHPRMAKSPLESDPASNIGMSAKELQEHCKGSGLRSIQNCSIIGDNLPPPAPPSPPKVNIPLRRNFSLLLLILM